MNNTSQRQQAFEQLVQQHDRRLFAYIFSLVRVLADAEDVFQETCVALWEQFDKYEPGSDFIAWGCTVARFRVLKFFERNKRAHMSFSADVLDRLEHTFVELEDAGLAARREALSQCVEKLTSHQQDMLWDSYNDKHGVARLAARLGRTTHSIHSSLRHIRAVLYRCIDRVLAGKEAT